MCANCTDTSVVLPIGNIGANGIPGTAYNGVDGIEEHIVFDTSVNISYTVNDFLNSVPVDTFGTPDFSQFRTIGYLIFPGTNNLHGVLPNKAYIIGNIVTNQWLVRIRNSNNVIIVESTAISNTSKQIIDLGVPTNIPANLDILTIEVYPLIITDITSTINLDSLSLIQQ